MEKSLSISVEGITRSLVFNSEYGLREALAENKQLQYLAGLEPIHHTNFPGMYIAGFKTSDNVEHNPTAIQKQ